MLNNGTIKSDYCNKHFLVQAWRVMQHKQKKTIQTKEPSKENASTSNLNYKLPH